MTTAQRGRRAVKSDEAHEVGNADLATIAADFRDRFPDEWEALRLCPLQHGLDDMIRLLKA